MEIKIALKGAAIGAANIIPGVSGGTMALMLGVYEPIIELLSSIRPKELLAAFRSKKSLIAYWKAHNFSLAVSIGIGAVLAVALLSKVLKYSLVEAHDPTYGFFFGLILASIVIPFQLVKKKNAAVFLSIALGVASVVTLSHAISPQEKIENAQKKLVLKTAKAAKTQSGAQLGIDTAQIISFFVAGMIGISAMILPGLSGSFVLLLLGMYFEVIDAIASLDIFPLLFFAIGCGLGLLVFSRFLKWLLENFHDTTMAFLTGLVFGSLYAVWPFKSFEMVGSSRIDLENQLPSMYGMNEILTLVFVLIGFSVVVLFLKYEQNKKIRSS